jgi:photosystem II stability/assembly factor-like uncharacterized protein
MHTDRFASMAFLVALTFAPGAVSAQGRGGSPSVPKPHPAGPLHFQYLGPASAGRVAAIAGIPGDTMTYFIGAASGGVWKTTDGGKTFEPTFDGQDVQAIGALAVAPSNPLIVWAGTGEAWAIRDADVTGDGVYKSTDGGETWTHMGLPETGRIGTIVVHPTNPDIVYVCALGRTTADQQERGVFKTTDGGATWKRVLFVDGKTGCSGLSMDAHDPKTLFAGEWQVEMRPWVENDGGPGSGIYVTHDGGSHWKHVTDGLPKGPLGKIDVAVAATDSKRVYALIETHNQGSVWRSDDGGGTWRRMSWDRTLIGRAGYYTRIRVNPRNEDEVLVANSGFHRSTDGGVTFAHNDRGCGDCHDIWMDPKNGDHWAVTGDGGAGITMDHGSHFKRLSLPIGQMYHVAIDRRVPYWVYSNRQDDGTMRGPSDKPIVVSKVPSYQPAGQKGGPSGGRGGSGGSESGRGKASPWQAGLGGCESGFTLPDVNDPRIVWASCYGDEVTRYDQRVGSARSVAPWRPTIDSPPTDVKYRCHWTPPLAIDPFDTKTVYYGCQVILKTSNGGQSWDEISPDLSTRDSSHIVFSGGPNGDNLGQFYGDVVFAIAPSKIRKGLIWAGTNDGKIWYTPDGGQTWKDVTDNVGMPKWGIVRKIQPSRFDPSTAYVAVDYHLTDDSRPYIYRTTDMGKSWTKISGGLPSGNPLDYVMAVTENPNRKGMLFAGTGHGFYYTMDDGAHWKRLKGGLPASPVTWIVVAPRYHDVVVSTYGRGLWVLRDITRLEQSDQAPKPDSTTYLYAPHDGFRLQRSGRADFLFSVAPDETGPATLDILDGDSTVIRSDSLLTVSGLNTATWDLRYKGPKQPKLRTVSDNPVIFYEPRMHGDSVRPVVHWGIQGPQRTGPIVAPGHYTVRLTVKDQSYEQPLTVIKDPKIPSSQADLEASTKAQIRIRDDIDTTVAMINHLEVLRKQIQDQVEANRKNASVREALEAFGKQAYDVELQLLSRPAMQSDDKWYPDSFHVYLNLVWLSAEVGSGGGDVQGGAGYRPTDASMEVLAGIEKKLAAAAADYQTLVSEQLPAFNEKMKGKIKPLRVGK